MPELPGQREHLSGGHGPVRQENRQAVTRERSIGEDVDMLEVHARHIRTERAQRAVHLTLNWTHVRDP